MTGLSAKASGTIRIGDEIEVSRLGYGTRRITGPGAWGEPEDRPGAIALLRHLAKLDINFIDTSDAYGPGLGEPLICEALYPYQGMLIATKAGMARTGPNKWIPLGRPEYLRQQVYLSLQKLKVEQITLWQLHRIDPKVDQDEQFGEIAAMQQEGLIRHVGLSEVTVEQIKAAQKYFKVVSVQNHYNLVTRHNEEVLNYCEQQGIVFIPWFPLGAGKLVGEGSPLQALAQRLDASPAQVALAWMLKRSPVMLPIPGTSKIAHLEENVAACTLQLSDEEFAALDEAGKAEWQQSQAKA